MDTPEDFVISVIRADQYMISHIGDKILSDLLIGKLIDIPFPLDYSNPAVAIGRTKLASVYDKAARVVREKPSCIPDIETYGMLKYVTDAEMKFTLNSINKTFIRNYIEIPEGTDELLEELRNIPLCA
jgi:hypothetical protein